MAPYLRGNAIPGCSLIFFGDLRMTRPEQNDDGHAPREQAKSVVVEFSSSPAKFLWDESTPSREVETKTNDKAVHVKAIVDVETRAKAPSRIAERYQVIGELGVGGQAHVYLAEDTTLCRKVAIKISRPDRPLSQAEQEQFKREAQAIAALKHPGIVTVHDFGIHDDGRCFIVLEYLPGQSLKDCLKNPETRKTFTIERTLELISRVAKALHYAHQRGIYHRDLKPGNILLDEHGSPHISDFGLAVTQESQRHLEGQVAGTIPYMAPEQVRGEAHWLNGQADIWALGVILYEMLAGRRPFQGESENDVKKEILGRTPMPLQQINENIPRELVAIVLRCLEKEIPDRYAVASDFLADVSSLEIRLSPRSHLVKGTRNKWLLPAKLMAVAVVLCLLSLGAINIYRNYFWNRVPVTSDKLPQKKSAPAPSDDAPIALPPRSTEKGIWVPLLDRTPQEIYWSRGNRNSAWAFDRASGTVDFKTNGFGFLQMGTVEAKDYEVSVQIDPARWKFNGTVGIFLGYRGDTLANGQPDQFQAIVTTSNDTRADMPFSLDRLYFKGKNSNEHSIIIGASPIKPVDLEPVTLSVTVQDDQIARVLLNGQPQTMLTYPAAVNIALHSEGITKLSCTGGIGLLVSGGGNGISGKFRLAQLKYH
jgi:serine/threonine protein kinase